MAYKKLTKDVSENEIYVLDLTSLLEGDELVDTLVSITSTPAGLTITEEEVNAAQVEVDDTVIDAYKSIQCRIAGGESGYEYKITAVFTTDDGDTETIHVLMIVADIASTEFQNYYGSVTEGGDYFATRLNSTKWNNTSIPTKRIALIEATRIIDRLNFKGEKTDENQVLQFPRFDDDEVPLDIEKATYEIALRLLEGYDVERQARSANVIARRYGPVSTSYKDSGKPEHDIAGIPSIRAWDLLKPYLIDPHRIIINRVS